MINNITNLNTNSLIEIKNLLEFCKTFVFKNKFLADDNETKISLYNSSYYVRACMNPLGNIPNNLPAYISANLIGSTNQDIINLYIKNTYTSIINETIPEDNYFAELNIYYRKLFIDYYNILINRYGDTDQSYNYNINILQTSYPEELERLLLYIFECRIYNHLDILYYNTYYYNTSNNKLSLFFEIYSKCKTYFLKTIYTEGFEIQENYFNFCRFFIIFMTLQEFINKKMEIVFDIDLLDDYSIINFLYSYGIYFLDDLPVYYQKRVIKNIQRLLSNKGNNQVIANILDIFELPDDSVFKYYMEKKYTGTTADDIKFIGIPYNEYSYINYIDSKQEKKVKPFEYFTNEDNSWKTEKDFILNPANNVDFDYIQTKYLSVESSFEIQTFAAECAFFFDTIYRSKKYSNNIFTKDKILTSYSYNGFDIFDGIIGLATLAMYINGNITPIIFKSKNNQFFNNRHAFLDNIEYDEGLVYYDDLLSENIYYDNLEEDLIIIDDLGDSNTTSLLSDSFNNTGLDISRYFTLNDMKVKTTKNITTNILSNLNFRKDFENTICDSTNYYEYRNLINDHKKLFQADTNRNYFTDYDNYLDYLQENCIDIYNLIVPLTKKMDEGELLKTFGLLAEDTKQFLDSKRLIWDIPYKESIFKYLYYMIDYFKSYTVQLDNFKIIFRFDNELENRLFLFDDKGVKANYVIADLVGGEMYEFQENPLSLYDNFYNFQGNLYYRQIYNTLKMNNTLRPILKDSYNLIVSTINQGSWNKINIPNGWINCGISDDGTKFLVANHWSLDGYPYYSSTGVSFYALTPLDECERYSCAISRDGTYLIVPSSVGTSLKYSTDGGTTWTNSSGTVPTHYYNIFDIACNVDGSKIIVVEVISVSFIAYYNYYISIDGGATFSLLYSASIANPPTAHNLEIVGGCSISNDGNVILLSNSAELATVSIDGGVSFNTTKTCPINISSGKCSMSNNGQIQIITAVTDVYTPTSDGGIWLSIDYGSSWSQIPTTSGKYYIDCSISGDGSKFSLVSGGIADSDYKVYTGDVTTLTLSMENISLNDNEVFYSVALSYDGSKKIAVSIYADSPTADGYIWVYN